MCVHAGMCVCVCVHAGVCVCVYVCVLFIVVCMGSRIPMQPVRILCRRVQNRT